MILPFKCAFLIFFTWSLSLVAQDDFTSSLKLTDKVPEELLASRSVVFYGPSFEDGELEKIQKMFAQTGIDAVAYIDMDVVLATRDVTLAYANYLTNRAIRYIIFLNKENDEYRMIVAPFNNKSTMIDPGQSGWLVHHKDLGELLTTVFRNSWISQKKQNFLVNEFPEKGVNVNWLTGNRAEFFAIDLKVDQLAVPFFNDAVSDTTLARMMKELYPFKYKTTSSVDEQELRKKGFLFVLCVMHTRGNVARRLLGYNVAKAESAYISSTFSGDISQLKTISADRPVYKFYVKHIPSGNIFLGTKWDADETWDLALRNYLKGFRAELKID